MLFLCLDRSSNSNKMLSLIDSVRSSLELERNFPLFFCIFLRFLLSFVRCMMLRGEREGKIYKNCAIDEKNFTQIKEIYKFWYQTNRWTTGGSFEWHRCARGSCSRGFAWIASWSSARQTLRRRLRSRLPNERSAGFAREWHSTGSGGVGNVRRVWVAVGLWYQLRNALVDFWRFRGCALRYRHRSRRFLAIAVLASKVPSGLWRKSRSRRRRWWRQCRVRWTPLCCWRSSVSRSSKWIHQVKAQKSTRSRCRTTGGECSQLWADAKVQWWTEVRRGRPKTKSWGCWRRRRLKLCHQVASKLTSRSRRKLPWRMPWWLHWSSALLGIDRSGNATR